MKSNSNHIFFKNFNSFLFFSSFFLKTKSVTVLTYLKMAKAYELKNETTEAIKHLVSALSLSSHKDIYDNMGPSIHFSLGRLYMKESKKEKNMRNSYNNNNNNKKKNTNK